MKTIRLSLKVRILIAIVAIAAIHAAFTVIPHWWDARPRFYPDAWAEANAILREEVGDAAVDNGLFFIPKDEVSVPRIQGVEIWFQPDSAPTRSPVYPDANMCLVRGDLVFLSSPWRIADVGSRKARHILAVFSYLSRLAAADLAGTPYEGPDSFSYAFIQDDRVDTCAGDDPDTVLGSAVKTKAGLRYFHRLQNGVLTFLDKEEEISRLAHALLKEVVPPRTQFQESLADMATDLLSQYPRIEAVDLLRKMQKMSGPVPPSNLPNWLKSIPVIGRLFTTPEKSYETPDPRWALTATLALGGKSPQESIDAALDLAFAEGETPEELRGFSPELYLLAVSPDAFRKRLMLEWPNLPLSRRLRYLSFFTRFGTDVGAVASLAAADEDVRVRFIGNYHLFRATGDQRSLDECLALLPLWGTLATEQEMRTYWDREYGYLANLYEEDRTLTPIPDYFIKAWRSLPQSSRNYDTFARLPLASAFATLVLATDPDAVQVALEIMDTCADTPTAKILDTQYYGFIAGMPVFIGYDGYEELIRTRDPAYADAMLAYLEKNAPSVEGDSRVTYTDNLVKSASVRELPTTGYADLAYTNILVARGDLRVLSVIEKELSRAIGATPREDPDRIAWLSRSAAEIRLRNAPDPLAHLLDSSEEERTRVAAPAADILAKEFTQDQLLALLADEQYAPVRLHIFLALVMRRQLDKESVTDD